MNNLEYLIYSESYSLLVFIYLFVWFFVILEGAIRMTVQTTDKSVTIIHK